MQERKLYNAFFYDDCPYLWTLKERWIPPQELPGFGQFHTSLFRTNYSQKEDFLCSILTAESENPQLCVVFA